MNTLEQKIKKIASQNPASKWQEDVAYRKANKGWLDKSFEIALRILDAIDSSDMNQTKLAAALGVSKQQVSKIVKGQTNFTLETLDKIEKILDIKLVTVLQEDEIVVQKEVHEGYRSAIRRSSTPFNAWITSPNSEKENNAVAA